MDFLTFKSFISTEALIVFYYVGAIFLPVGIWHSFTYIIKKYVFVSNVYKKGQSALWGTLSKNHKRKVIIAFIISFVFMELFWRMLFEFLIAYMQMRDALLLSHV